MKKAICYALLASLFVLLLVFSVLFPAPQPETKEMRNAAWNHYVLHTAWSK